MVTKKRMTVPGRELVKKVQELLRDRNVQRVCLRDEEKSLLEIPGSVGDPAAPGSVLEAPVMAALQAFSTLVNDCIIEVETTPSKGA